MVAHRTSRPQPSIVRHQSLDRIVSIPLVSGIIGISNRRDRKG